MNTNNNSIGVFRDSKDENLANDKLYNFQIDYVKVSLDVKKRENLDWDNLLPHPNLKNHYILNPELTEFAKNFSLYFRKDNHVFLKFSIPYFLKGHNYTTIGEAELKEVEWKLKKWLNINIKYAKIEEFEFGMFEKIDIDCKKYLSGVLGVHNYILEKSDPHFKMFGIAKQKVHYKIYDAVANSKSKKTFSIGNFPKDKVIKHELKFEKVYEYFNFTILFNDLYETPYITNQCKKLLFEKRVKINFRQELEYTPVKEDLTNILYTALKNLESVSKDGNIVKLLYEVIERTKLSPSQKSKRRKSIEILEESYNLPF